MDAIIAPSAQLYAVSNYLLPKSLEGLSREELYRQAGGGANPVIWIVGHVTHSRCSLLNLLGKKREIPWKDLFARGVKDLDFRRYPHLDEILAVWNEAGAELAARFDELSDEELSAESPHKFPVSDNTIRGAINFMAYHEGYHMGQLAYLRKWLGKGSLVG